MNSETIRRRDSEYFSDLESLKLLEADLAQALCSEQEARIEKQRLEAVIENSQHDLRVWSERLAERIKAAAELRRQAEAAKEELGLVQPASMPGQKTLLGPSGDEP